MRPDYDGNWLDPRGLGLGGRRLRVIRRRLGDGRLLDTRAGFPGLKENVRPMHGCGVVRAISGDER